MTKNTMKIGIITLPLVINYGGILQAYALQTYLGKLGHKAFIIKIAPSGKYRSGIYSKIKSYISSFKRWFLLYALPAKYSTNKMYYTQKFIYKYLKVSVYQSFEEIMQSEFDAFVVGSDQIWRNKYVSGYRLPLKDVYLDFAKNWNVKRISYAASFGTDEWEYDEKQTKECRELLARFDAVSVREETGIDLCRQYLNKEATKTVDPTLLLDKEDYVKLFHNRKTCIGNSLMTYILDESPAKNYFINYISVQLGLTINKVYNPNIENKNSIRGNVQPPIEDWLRGFYEAGFVVTDSFHACVFSIIFNKPFLVIPNLERGTSRFHSLLKACNQEFRIIEDVDSFKITDDILSAPSINWRELRSASIDFLIENLR